IWCPVSAAQPAASRDTDPLSLHDALPILRLAGKYQGRVTGHFVQPGREGRYAPLPEALPERLAAALRARGVEQLYAHQAQAWERSEEHTSELQSRENLVCRLLLEKKNSNR